MKKLIFTLFIVGLFSSLHAQNDDYYYNNGEQIFLEPYHKKKYIVVDSTITSESELTNALDDTSLTINTFQESSVLIHLNIYDSTAYEKQYAILQSQDSIDESELLNNPVVNYVGPYYILDGNLRGISHLFYVRLNQENDIVILDSIANSHNVTILGNDTYMPLWYTLECTENSTDNALEMANLFYESNYFEHSYPDLMLGGSIIVDIKEHKKFKIFPNPAKDYIYIDRKQSNLKIKEIMLYNMSGKKIKTYSIDSNKLNIKELQSGLYILNIGTANNQFTYKIMKK